MTVKSMEVPNKFASKLGSDVRVVVPQRWCASKPKMAVSRKVQTQRCIPCRIRGVERTAGVVVVVPRRRRRKGEAFPDPAAGSPWTTALSAGGAVQRRSECTSECIGRVARREMTHTRWYCGSSTWHLKFPSLKHPRAAVLNLSFRTRLLLF